MTMQRDRFTEFRASITEAEEKGFVKGIATEYGVPIQRGPGLYEKVLPGAFRAQLNAANRISVLWQHDSDNPIGRATHLEDKENALHFVAKIVDHEDVPDARKALALLREGVVEEISVGFQWQQWHEERDEEKHEITIVHEKARLRELSVVTFGALGSRARVLTMAALDSGVNVGAYRARLGALNS